MQGDKPKLCRARGKPQHGHHFNACIGQKLTIIIIDIAVKQSIGYCKGKPVMVPPQGLLLVDLSFFFLFILSYLIVSDFKL